MMTVEETRELWRMQCAIFLGRTVPADLLKSTVPRACMIITTPHGENKLKQSKISTVWLLP